MSEAYNKYFSKGEVIRSRLRLNEHVPNEVCSFHMVKCLRVRKACDHPVCEHSSKKISGLQPLTKEVFQKLIKKFPSKVVPANGFLCTNHRKNLNIQEKDQFESFAVQTEDPDVPTCDPKAFEVTTSNKKMIMKKKQKCLYRKY